MLGFLQQLVVLCLGPMVLAVQIMVQVVQLRQLERQSFGFLDVFVQQFFKVPHSVLSFFKLQFIDLEDCLDLDHFNIQILCSCSKLLLLIQQLLILDLQLIIQHFSSIEILLKVLHLSEVLIIRLFHQKPQFISFSPIFQQQRLFVGQLVVIPSDLQLILFVLLDNDAESMFQGPEIRIKLLFFILTVQYLLLEVNNLPFSLKIVVFVAGLLKPLHRIGTVVKQTILLHELIHDLLQIDDRLALERVLFPEQLGLGEQGLMDLPQLPNFKLQFVYFSL